MFFFSCSSWNFIRDFSTILLFCFFSIVFLYQETSSRQPFFFSRFCVLRPIFFFFFKEGPFLLRSASFPASPDAYTFFHCPWLCMNRRSFSYTLLISPPRFPVFFPGRRVRLGLCFFPFLWLLTFHCATDLLAGGFFQRSFHAPRTFFVMQLKSNVLFSFPVHFPNIGRSTRFRNVPFFFFLALPVYPAPDVPLAPQMDPRPLFACVRSFDPFFFQFARIAENDRLKSLGAKITIELLPCFHFFRVSDP